MPEEPPAKKVKLLDDSSSEDRSDNESGGVPLKGDDSLLRVNEKYARRFEHNQKRAELHRLEEKFGPSKGNNNAEVTGEEDSSSDEEEDDDGVLASGTLDNEVIATLNALRNKDPRVYDKTATFYTTVEGEESNDQNKEPTSKEKSMFLRDYHRENLLNGNLDPEKTAPPRTYAQEQDELRDSIVKEFHTAAGNGLAEQSEDLSVSRHDDSEFLVKKDKPSEDGQRTEESALNVADIEAAYKDPDRYLSRYIDSRGWIAPEGSKLHPFESDDEEEENRAEEFEQAYNLRFENQRDVNERLVTHARDAAAKYSARQESSNKRKRVREAEKAMKEKSKQQNAEEKSRLRKLRLEEANEKVKRIKEAAGLGSKQLELEDWQDFLTEEWDDGKWEAEMKRRFGEDYYAEKDRIGSEEEEGIVGQKVKKPKWKDDIHITDLVPDFDDDENAIFSLPEDENSSSADVSSTSKAKRNKREKEAQKREMRKERREIERLVDENLDIEFALKLGSRKGPTTFRYRETSPLTFGLTSKDILMATDSQLNQFAGLKKIAQFRDVEKKRKDRKRLGKKARLRQWRKEAFGNENGPQKSLQDLLRETQGDEPTDTSAAQETPLDIREGKRRKRSKKKH